jgi:hypothetical protein
METEETKTKRDDKRKVDPGSPITVGGGGGVGGEDVTELNMSCVFKETDYPEPAGNPGKKRFRRAGWRIRTFKISTKDGIVDHSDLLPQNGNCIIEVHCEGDNDDVTINGNNFGIDMNTGTYQKDSEGIVHRNPNPDSYISRVDLTAPGKNLGSWFFSQQDNCAVCTDYISNSAACT